MAGGGAGSTELIKTEGSFEGGGWMTSGREDWEQEEGQRVKAMREVDQSSSGLWALSQSVPRMMSCVPTVVT